MLTLLPEVLQQHGGYASCVKERWVQGRHAFLCLEADDEGGHWLPLYSGAADDRVLLPNKGRIGHHWWTGGDFYYHPLQVWTFSHAAAVAAATQDYSRPGDRNMQNDLVPDAGTLFGAMSAPK